MRLLPKNVFWEWIENAGVPMLYILQLTSVHLYSSRGACAKKRDNTVLHYYIVPDRMHSYRYTALSEVSNIGIMGKILLCTIWYHALLFFRCGVYKYCCSGRSTGQSGAETKYGVPTVRGQCYYYSGIYSEKWDIRIIQLIMTVPRKVIRNTWNEMV